MRVKPHVILMMFESLKPASGLEDINAQIMNSRTVTTSLRYSF